MPAVLTELYTGEVIKKLRWDRKWVASIPSKNNYVNNNVIHLTDIGADPTVLINNAAYPIASSLRDDTDLPLALRKFETTNTRVQDDELYALSYDKIATVVDQHSTRLEEVTQQYGLFSIAPTATTTNTPIVGTTGVDNGFGRKRMTLTDLALAKKRLDDLNIPLVGRILVLCNDHINDLNNLDQSFRDRFYNTKTGDPIDFMGFTIFQDTYNPVYDNTNTKKAWNAAPAGTDRNSSQFFYAPHAFKAMGSLTMYYSDAKTNPTTRESVIGFRLYHAIAPVKLLGFGAIVSQP